MPPSKLTAEERSAQLQQQSAVTPVKSDALLVKEVLRVHGGPAVAASKRALTQLGFIDEKGTVVPPAKALVAARAKAPQLANEAHKWNDGFDKCWSQSRVSNLRELFSVIDPVALSELNVRKLGKKHAKEPPKVAMCGLFTFVFNLDYDGQVPDFASHDAMVMYLKKRYIDAGERAHSSPLPLDYSSAGVFSITHAEGSWWVIHRFTQAKTELSTLDDPVGTKELFIEHNDSDSKATLRDKDDEGLVMQCGMLVSAAYNSSDRASEASGSMGGMQSGRSVFPTPPSEKRRRFSLMDRLPPFASSKASPAPKRALCDGAVAPASPGDAPSAYHTPKKALPAQSSGATSGAESSESADPPPSAAEVEASFVPSDAGAQSG